MVLITTGSQGESMAALSRMAANMHKKVMIKPGDTVIFSSNPIPGNEKAVSKVINELCMKGADVIFQDAHVSGHACQEEIKLIYTLVKPEICNPGTRRVPSSESAGTGWQIASALRRIIFLFSRAVMCWSCPRRRHLVVGHVQTGAILVDGLGVGDVGNIVLRDRQHLAEDGILIVVLTLDKYSNQVLAGPDIVSRGFVYVRESEDLMDEARSVVNNAADELPGPEDDRLGQDQKYHARDSLSEFLWKRTKRSPMILPIIMEVDE